VKLRLTPAARRLVASNQRVAARAVVVSRGAKGRKRTARRAVTIVRSR
jgi:tetraacyldisaccharide-1-P 4'-kinase